MAHPGNYLFSTEELGSCLDKKRQEIRALIAHERDDYIVSLNEAAYVASIESRFQIEELQFFPEQAFVAWEGDRTVTFESRFGGTGTRNVHHITFAVPWSGPRWLFDCQPDRFTTCPPQAVIAATDLQWTYATENRTPEHIRQEFDSSVSQVFRYVGWINEMISHWNQTLRGLIEPQLRDRKERLSKGATFAQSFGLPIRSRAASQNPVPVPISRKRIDIPKPSTATTPAERARILSDAIYEEILGNLRNMNLVIERSPSAFTALDEEALRWHFLVQLNSNFESGATGETFSKKGKTDIFLPADGRAAFIAECKFWSGPSSFSPIID